MKRRIAVVTTLVVLAYGCATSAPQPEKLPETLRGVASWYGEEFAGRTTANGEIFDPTLLTAAHRTLPFGTILEVKNARTNQTVLVRVNDRGPYIANRMIDLSYAAAQKIGLVEPGVGDVDIKVMKLGSGEREAPAPFDVTIAEAPAVAPAPAAAAPAPSEAPPVAFPLPVTEEPAIVNRVVVETQRGDVVTRKAVADDGRTITEKPTGERAAPSERRREASASSGRRPALQYVVQVGAFAVEENAKSLQERLASLGQRAWVDRDGLFRVRIGPFATRELAAQARTSLEANGLSAIILSE